MKQYRVRVLVALACALMAPSVSWATDITIVKAKDLAFGSFAAGSGGSVVISGALRGKTGGVVLLTSDAGGRAEFTVKKVDTTDTTYTITLPAGATLTSGGNEMTVGTFTSSPSGTGALSVTGETLFVGATLTVGNNQAAGVYSGTFSVTVVHP